jgi:lipoprotein signal peptidase
LKRFSLSPNWLAAAALLLIGALYAMAYFKLYSRWWFEDDPALFAYAGGIGNPITIFVDANVVRHFTTGKALVPMQIFSYLMDVRVAGFSRRSSPTPTKWEVSF